MFDLLNEYPNNGSFKFKSTDSLNDVCNAPTNKKWSLHRDCFHWW